MARPCGVAETDPVRAFFLICGLAVPAALAAALAVTHGASADRLRLNQADQSAAKRDVLHLSDLPSTVKWKATKFDSNDSSGVPTSCSHLDYSSPQIVDTAQAGSQFTTPGILVMSQVGLVSQSSMIDLIWKHTFARPMTRCIGEAFSKGGAGQIKVLSTHRLALPRLAQNQAAYRVVFQLAVQGKSVRGACDLVMLGGGRTLSMLMVMGIIGAAAEQAKGEQAMTLIDLGLSEAVAARSFAADSSTALTA
jgi:hypothetical protein